MSSARPSKITIQVGDIIDLGDLQKPQEWLIEGFNPDNSIIITRKGRWKTIQFKLQEKS